MLFTFHNVSINSANQYNGYMRGQHLHSIMYLLIPNVEGFEVLIKTFTFHNVSINSWSVSAVSL